MAVESDAPWGTFNVGRDIYQQCWSLKTILNVFVSAKKVYIYLLNNCHTFRYHLDNKKIINLFC